MAGSFTFICRATAVIVTILLLAAAPSGAAEGDHFYRIKAKVKTIGERSPPKKEYIEVKEGHQCRLGWDVSTDRFECTHEPLQGTAERKQDGILFVKFTATRASTTTIPSSNAVAFLYTDDKIWNDAGFSVILTAPNNDVEWKIDTVQFPKRRTEGHEVLKLEARVYDSSAVAGSTTHFSLRVTKDPTQVTKFMARLNDRFEVWNLEFERDMDQSSAYKKERKSSVAILSTNEQFKILPSKKVGRGKWKDVRAIIVADVENKIHLHTHGRKWRHLKMKKSGELMFAKIIEQQGGERLYHLKPITIGQ